MCPGATALFDIELLWSFMLVKRTEQFLKSQLDTEKCDLVTVEPVILKCQSCKTPTGAVTVSESPVLNVNYII